VEAHLLPGLPQGAREIVLVLVAAPAGEGDLPGVVRKVFAALQEDDLHFPLAGVEGDQDGGRAQSGKIGFVGDRGPGERLAQGIEEPIRHQPRCSSMPAPSMARRSRPSAIRYPTKTITERFFKKAMSPAIAA